jgi:hypothetical protein
MKRRAFITLLGGAADCCRGKENCRRTAQCTKLMNYRPDGLRADEVIE